MLRHVRKTAKRNLRLTSVTEGDGNSHESQTEAPEVEGTMTTINNIGYTKGAATRATELSCEVKTGQPAKDGAVQREEEEEAEEQKREKSRMKRKEERVIHAMLQLHKQERDIEKAIQAEDELVKDEEEEEISEELDELFDEAKKVVKNKSYWNERLPEREIKSGLLDKTAQIRVPGRGHRLRDVKGRITFVKRSRGMIQGRRPLKSEIRLRVVREEAITVQGQLKTAKRLQTCWDSRTQMT